MKKIWILAAVFAVASCTKKAPVDYAVLTGQITNPVPGELSINSYDRTVKEVISVSEDGSFSDTLTIKRGTYILYDGKNRTEIYVGPGDVMNVTFDGSDFANTVAFTGESAGPSNYLVAKAAKQKELRGKENPYMLDEEAYVAKQKADEAALNELLAASENVSADYVSYEQKGLEYDRLANMMNYERAHAYYTKKEDFKVSEGFYTEIDALDYNNEADFQDFRSYQSLVGSHYRKSASDIAEAEGVDDDVAYLKAIAASPSQEIKNTLAYQSAQYGITYTDDLEGYYAAYKAVSTDEKNNIAIDDIYAKLQTVAPGKDSPIFEDYENYKGGTSSLADFKGKFVYVDVWATWCGPCKAEIPSLKKVEKEYHGKNIEFISISVDKRADHDKWMNMVAEKELGGVQLFAENDWNSKFVQDYLIKGIPRFILIDPDGKIVSSNAPRPSDSKLIDLFNELNI